MTKHDVQASVTRLLEALPMSGLSHIKHVGVSDRFWVVTYLKPSYDIGDMVFEADIRSLMLQARGGLQIDDVFGVCANRADALADGQRLMSETA